MAKHVKESLGQFLDFQYFSLFEAKKDKAPDEKKMNDEDSKDGSEILKKVRDNFERFKSAAGEKIIKYKEFWKENEETKGKFDASGSIYKLFDSDYVVGVLSLPDEALSDEEIDAQIEEVDKEGTGEEKSEETPEETPEETEEIKESLNEEAEPEVNLDDDEKDPEGLNIGSGPELSTDTKPELPAEDEEGIEGGESELGGEELPAEGEGEEGFGTEEVETKEFFVVYDMTGEDRDEIFRTEDPGTIEGFKDFFENSFKGAMKEQIAKFKQAQEDKKHEAELKAKEKKKEEQKGKLGKFLSA